MNHHAKRWITGLLFTPLLLAVIFYSSEMIFSFFIIAVIQLAVWEYNTLVFDKYGYAWERGEVYLFAFVIPLALYFYTISALIPVIALSLFITFLIFLLQIREDKIDVFKTGKVILGFMYLPFFVSHFILLRHVSNGVLWVFFTLFIAFCGDVSGFYIGRTFGLRKLHPFVSPGKTIEGALGMIMGSLLGGLIFQKLFFQDLAILHAVILGALGGIMGQLGDLFESAIKRTAGAKDAGFIFPGHGGIMDRLDSISFIAPIVFYYLTFVIK
jgi:phosphatidate cytidylyltransferase